MRKRQIVVIGGRFVDLTNKNICNTFDDLGNQIECEELQREIQKEIPREFQ